MSYDAEQVYRLYRLRHRARVAVRRAIDRGDLAAEACHCGGPGEAHHYLGYEREHWLHVVWVCRAHHAAEHERWGSPLWTAGEQLGLGL